MKYGNSRKYMKNLLAGSMSVALAASMVTMTVPITALAATGTSNAMEQGAELKKVDVEWGAKYVPDEYGFGDPEYITLYPTGDGVKLPTEWKQAIAQVKVGEEAKTKAAISSIESEKEYAVTNYAVSLGVTGFVNGDNTVIISAEGYEDVILIVTFDSENKTASFKGLGANENPNVDEIEADVAEVIQLDEGTYSFTAALHKTGTSEASHVSNIVDKNVKVVKTSEGYELSILIPESGAGTMGAKASMVKDVVVKDAKRDYISGKKTNIEDTGVQYTFKAESFAKKSVVAFGVEGASYHGSAYEKGKYDTYLTADLDLSQDSNWWAGYNAQAPVNLADGLYRMRISTMQAGGKDAGEPSAFTEPLMGGNVLGEYVWIEVKNGKYTAVFDTESVRNVNLTNYRYYTKSGDYCSDANAESYLKSARTLAEVRAEDGSTVDGSYADVISVDLAGKGVDPYVFLRMELPASATNMPFPALVNDAVWVALMDWTSLEKIDAAVETELQEAVAAAESIASDSEIKDLNDSATWIIFENRLEAAQEGVNTFYTLTSEQQKTLASNLKAAQEALKTSDAGGSGTGASGADDSDIDTPDPNTDTAIGLAGNLTYKLENGVLTISGTGEMELTDGSAPWLAGQEDGIFKSTANITEVVIEDGVTSIDKQAFRGCSALTKVTLPSSLKSIGYEAFRDCDALVDVLIPDSVETMGGSVFYDDESLKNVTLSSSLKSLSSNAFTGCAALETIELPKQMECIGGSAFANSGIVSIAFNEGLKTIERSAFEKCEKLVSVSFPASLEAIGDCAFLKCINLETVVFAGSPSVGQSAFSDTKYENNKGDFAIDENGVLTKYSGTNATEVRIPEGVTEIAAMAFGRSNNKHPEIEKVVIPASVKKIGAFAFDYCTGLKTVIMEGTVAPTLGYGAFNGASLDDLQIIVPEGATGYGDTGDSSNFWTTYADQTGTEAQLAERKADREAAAEEAASISEAIKNLPEVIDITSSDKDSIEALKARFDALNAEGKKQVSDELKTRLNKACDQLQKILDAAGNTDGVKIVDTFGDKALQAILLRNYDADRNGYLNENELAVTKLDISGGIEDSKTGEQLFVKDLTGIECFSNLESLDASGNQIESIDLSVFKEGDLEVANLSGNKLSAVDCSVLEWLKELDVSNNQLVSLDVSGNASLTTLKANNNNLSEVKAHKKLQTLSVANNKIASIDLSTLVNLSSLNVSNNSLASLDVSKSKNLQTLSVANNKLVSIDLSSLTSLDTLSLKGNKLNSLDVSKNTKLYELNVSGNALVALDLSANSELGKFTASDVSASAECEGDNFDLRQLSDVIDASRISSVEGATLDGTQLSGIVSTSVTYVYDCGNGKSMNVALTLTKKSGSETSSDDTGVAAANSFGSGSIQIPAGTYDVTVGLKNAADTSKDSMAAACLETKGKLIVDADGNAKIRVNWKSMTMAGMTAYADELECYADSTKGSSSAATVIATHDNGKPNTVEFAIADASKALDGVYISMAVTGTPMTGRADAFLAIDYSTVKAVSGGETTGAGTTDQKTSGDTGNNGTNSNAGKTTTSSKKTSQTSAAKVKTITINSATVTSKTVKAAVKKAGVTAKSTTTVVFGSNVKAVSANAFKGVKGVTAVVLGKNVKTIKANAFKGSSVKTITLKTKKLTKKSVKNALKGSSVKTIKVAVGSKSANKKYVKAYKKIFTKKIAGKKATVK